MARLGNEQRAGIRRSCGICLPGSAWLQLARPDAVPCNPIAGVDSAAVTGDAKATSVCPNGDDSILSMRESLVSAMDRRIMGGAVAACCAWF